MPKSTFLCNVCDRDLIMVPCLMPAESIIGIWEMVCFAGTVLMTLMDIGFIPGALHGVQKRMRIEMLAMHLCLARSIVHMRITNAGDGLEGFCDACSA